MANTPSPSVLAPFAAKGETWTYSDVEVRARRVLDRALDECKLRLNAVVSAPDAPVDLTQAQDALRHLEGLAVKLGVTNEEATAELREVEGTFHAAKNAAREKNPDAPEGVRTSTRAIANIYARARAVAGLVHAVARQKAAQQRTKQRAAVPAAKPAPAAKPVIKRAVVAPPPAPNGEPHLRESEASSSDEFPLEQDVLEFLEGDGNGSPEGDTQIGKNDEAKR